MTGDLLRETFEVNRRALELGLEPPVCVTWDADSCRYGPSHLSDPWQSIDHQRLSAFRRMMYELGES